MASRSYGAFGVLLAGAFGITTAYVAFQPELQKQSEERQGIFHEQHVEEEKGRENVISDAIRQDLREAEEQITGGQGKKGAFWGIREAIWGAPPGQKLRDTASPNTPPQPVVLTAAAREGESGASKG